MTWREACEQALTDEVLTRWMPSRHGWAVLFPRQRAVILAALQPVFTALEAKRECVWTLASDDSHYETSCGHAFVFTTDGPKENGMQFCGYCGGTLKEETR